MAVKNVMGKDQNPLDRSSAGRDQAADLISKKEWLEDTTYWVPVANLEPNPKNAKYSDSKEYRDAIEKDIAERGIVVPLIVKRYKDRVNNEANDEASNEAGGVVLAGNYRLTVAIKLGIKKVPVQYVKSELTPRQIERLVFRDNWVRRHPVANRDDRINAYKILFPDFDERVNAETRGGDRKSNGNVSRLIGGGGLTAKVLNEAAKAACLPIGLETIKKDLAHARKMAKGERPTKTPTAQDPLVVIDGYCQKIRNTIGTQADKKVMATAIEKLLNLIETIDDGNLVDDLKPLFDKIGVTKND